MSTNGFPRLLVATEFPPNASGGGPAVVRQMLKGWPIDNLFWWSCRPDRDERFGQQTAGQLIAQIPPRLYPNQRWVQTKCWLLENFWGRWATRHFRRTLEIVRPEVVWVVTHGWAILPLAKALSELETGFHVSVHDYMDARGYIGSLGRNRSERWVGLTEELYARAASRDVISEPMNVDLRQRTGAEANQICRAGLDEQDFDWLVKKKGESGQEIRIAYAGSILVEDAFELFANAANKIRQRMATPIKLEIFGSHTYRERRWFDNSWMREGGNLPEPALSEALRACTWGFVPMGLDDSDPRYNRFSLPTKFSSYLAAGLPVITMGHPESSLVKIAKTYELGPCLQTRDLETLTRELAEALATKTPWEKHRAEVLRCSQHEFDARQMRHTLHKCFRVCAERTAERRTR